MFRQQNVMQRSRLGRLLVQRGYITELQLDAALSSHEANGLRLGEQLIASGLLTEKDLARTLRHQQRYRYAAAFAAFVVTPLQPTLALAAGNSASAGLVRTGYEQPVRGLQALDEAEMADIGAQGLGEFTPELANLLGAGLLQVDEAGFAARDRSEGDNDLPGDAIGLDGVRVLGTIARKVLPMGELLDAEVEMVGVQYDVSRLKPMLTEDGSGFNLNMPARIERLSFNNIRPKGVEASGPTMGSVHLEGIQFTDSVSIVIKPGQI